MVLNFSKINLQIIISLNIKYLAPDGTVGNWKLNEFDLNSPLTEVQSFETTSLAYHSTNSSSRLLFY